VLESVFTFLFKYAPDLFRRGDVALVVPGGLRFWAILAAVVAGRRPSPTPRSGPARRPGTG
jgi:hypothetical protein